VNLPDWWPHDKPYAIMDCLEGMKELPDKCVDLVLTDPPYNLGIDYGDTTDDNREDYFNWCSKWFEECKRVTDFIIITPGRYNIYGWNEIDGFEMGIWINKMQQSRSRISYLSKWEPIIFYGKPKKRAAWDIWSYNSNRGDGFNTHPCPKPQELFFKLITDFSNKNDIILDLFLGSGTLLESCRKTNRIGLGFEINPEYEPIIRKRGMDEELINGKWHKKQEQQEWW